MCTVCASERGPTSLFKKGVEIQTSKPNVSELLRLRPCNSSFNIIYSFPYKISIIFYILSPHLNLLYLYYTDCTWIFHLSYDTLKGVVYQICLVTVSIYWVNKKWPVIHHSIPETFMKTTHCHLGREEDGIFRIKYWHTVTKFWALVFSADF